MSQESIHDTRGLRPSPADRPRPNYNMKVHPDFDKAFRPKSYAARRSASNERERSEEDDGRKTMSDRRRSTSSSFTLPDDGTMRERRPDPKATRRSTRAKAKGFVDYDMKHHPQDADLPGRSGKRKQSVEVIDSDDEDQAGSRKRRNSVVVIREEDDEVLHSETENPKDMNPRPVAGPPRKKLKTLGLLRSAVAAGTSNKNPARTESRNHAPSQPESEDDSNIPTDDLIEDAFAATQSLLQNVKVERADQVHSEPWKASDLPDDYDDIAVLGDGNTAPSGDGTQSSDTAALDATATTRKLSLAPTPAFEDTSTVTSITTSSATIETSFEPEHDLEALKESANLAYHDMDIISTSIPCVTSLSKQDASSAVKQSTAADLEVESSHPEPGTDEGDMAHTSWSHKRIEDELRASSQFEDNIVITELRSYGEVEANLETGEINSQLPVSQRESSRAPESSPASSSVQSKEAVNVSDPIDIRDSRPEAAASESSRTLSADAPPAGQQTLRSSGRSERETSADTGPPSAQILHPDQQDMALHTNVPQDFTETPLANKLLCEGPPLDDQLRAGFSAAQSVSSDVPAASSDAE